MAPAEFKLGSAERIREADDARMAKTIQPIAPPPTAITPPAATPAAPAAPSAFVVERGVPLPQSKHGPSIADYPFAELQPGDSFFAPGHWRAPVQAVYRYGKRNGVKLFCRRTKGPPEGVRIWMIGPQP